MHSVDPNDSYIIVEYMSGVFRGSEFSGYWTKVSNTPYYNTDDELYGDVLNLITPRQWQIALTGSNNTSIKNTAEKLGITAVGDNLSKMYTYLNQRVFNDVTDYSGKTIALLRLTQTGNRISNLLKESGKEFLYHSCEGISEGNYIEIKGSSVNTSSWDSNTSSSTGYFNRIHKISYVLGAWKSDSTFMNAIGSSSYSSTNVSAIKTGNIYKIVNTGSTTSDSTWASLGADSSPAVGEEFTAIIDGTSSMGNGQVQIVDDVLIVVLDTPEVTYKTNSISFNTSQTGTFDLINDYKVLKIKNTGQDNLKIKNIVDSGDYKIFEYTNIAKKDSTTGASTPIPANGYSSGSELTISPNSEQEFYLFFNKSNFGTFFDKTTLEIESNYPEVYTYYVTISILPDDTY